MARPTKKEDVKREIVVRCRMTILEKNELLQNAKQDGLKYSDYIRVRTTGSQPLKKVTPEREALIRGLAQLGKIGSNVNQIAHVLNMRDNKNDGVNPKLIEYSLREIYQLTKQLNELLDGRHG
jgi:hypothetical protein